jgi:hypothetical protein
MGSLAVIDGGGAYGIVLQNSLTFVLMAGAALVFIYLWRKGRLDMDEEPKMQMFDAEHDGIRGDSDER